MTVDSEETQATATGSEPVVALTGVSKRYGRRWVLHDVEMAVYPGEIIGFIGPNGSGKTTLMRIMAGLAHATRGEATVLGQRARGGWSPPGVGLVLEQQGHIPYLSAHRNLALLCSITSKPRPEHVDQLLQRVGLDPSDRRPVGRWSQGMRQRLTLAQALFDQPRLLLLDEPTNGLDPGGVAWLRNLLAELSGQGVSVFLASHALTEVERLCERTYFVRSGRIVEVIDNQAKGNVAIDVSAFADIGPVYEWADQAGLSCDSTDAGLTILFDEKVEIPEVVAGLAAVGVRIEGVRRQRPSLEERFLLHTQGGSS